MAATLDAALVGSDDMILVILGTQLDPIIAALDTHTTHLDACQEVFNHLTTQLDNRNCSNPSKNLVDIMLIVN